MGLNLKKLANTVIGKGAKVLGNVIGGPVGGAVTNIIASAFGADPDDSDDIIAKINADPEAAIKLMELENKHKERLQELSIEAAKVQLDMEKAYLSDVQSAREREIRLIEKTGKPGSFQYLLAGFVFFGFFVLTAFLIFAHPQLDDGIKPVLNMLFGGLVSGFATVLAYYFGSSKGSADKNALLRTPTQSTQTETK